MPETGRFISEDPWPGDVTIPQTLNPYPYVLNNPLKYVDPLGLRVEYEAYGGGYKNSPVANTTNSVIKKNTSNDTKYSQCPKGIADLEDIIYIGNVNSSYIPPNIGRRIASAGVGFIPVIGDIKDIQEVLTGYDIVAGEKLSWVDRGITLICAFVPIINGKAAREGLKLVDEGIELGETILKNADEFIERTIKTGFMEEHHLLPRQFKRFFEEAGLDIEDYKILLDKADHRLKPSGLHTGENNWNKQWKDFFRQNLNATKEEILNQLDKMMKAFGLK